MGFVRDGSSCPEPAPCAGGREGTRGGAQEAEAGEAEAAMRVEQGWRRGNRAGPDDAGRREPRGPSEGRPRQLDLQRKEFRGVRGRRSRGREETGAGRGHSSRAPDGLRRVPGPAGGGTSGWTTAVIGSKKEQQQAV